MKNGFRIGLVSFFLQSIQLILVQIFLRKLGLILPVDFVSFATILAVQFCSFAVALNLTAYLPAKARGQTAFGCVILLKTCLAILFVFSTTGLLTQAILFFILSGLEYALLFEFAQHGMGGQRFSGPKLNAIIYSGSAFGLFFAEKFLFKFLPLSTLTLIVSVVTIGIAATVFFTKSIFTDPVAEHDTISEGLSEHFAKGLAYFYAFAGGFLLFGGIFIVYRLLKIYLRETVDISAEITAISMLIGASVNYGISRLKTFSALKARHITVVAFLAGFVIFFNVSRHLSSLEFLPREIFIALLLISISGLSASLFSMAFLLSPKTQDGTRNILIVNAWGACGGALLFGLWLLPDLQLVRSFQVFAGCFLVFIAISLSRVIRGTASRVTKYSYWALGAAVFGFTVLQTVDTGWYKEQISRHVSKLVAGETVENIVESNFDIWTLTSARFGKTPVYHRLVSNSYSMSGTMFPSKRYMKLMSYLGWLYAANGETALNIGYGTGLTAQALLEFKDLKKLDVIDVTKAILPITSIVHAREISADPLHDGRLNFMLGGARDFLMRTDNRYDIITGEPPPPANSNVSYLYTKNFYELVRSRLKPQGAFTYWLPIHSVSRPATLQIIKTFCVVFENCDLFAGTEKNLILVGYSLGERQKQNLGEKFKTLQTTRFARDTGLASLEQLFSLLVASKPELELEYNSHRILSDDFAFIEEDYTRPLSSYRPFFQIFKNRQHATAQRCLESLYQLPKLNLSQIDFENIFTVDSALEGKTLPPAIWQAYSSHASPETLAWLFGLNENLERAMDAAALPETHYLMITRQAVREFQKRDPAAALRHLQKFPLETRMDKRLYKVWFLLEKLNIH